jgi:hypothetical protein
MNNLIDKHKKIVMSLLLLIIIISGITTIFGIREGSEINKNSVPYTFKSLDGEKITIYGKGIYKQVSGDMVIQGIAQDYVTLFLGIPVFLLGLLWFQKKKVKGLIMISGGLFYFFMTYMFYIIMGVSGYILFIYLILIMLTFFAFLYTTFSFDFKKVKNIFSHKKTIQNTGIFLVINSFILLTLWIIGIIKGFDLGILVPIGIIVGWLTFKENDYGYLMAATKVIFLSLLMASLTLNILIMALAGMYVIKILFVIPILFVISVYFSGKIIFEIKN